MAQVTIAPDDSVIIDLPELADLCVHVQQNPGEICVTFPGGTTVCAQFGYEFGDPADIIRSLFGSVNSALAPMTPIFDVIDCVVKIVECVKAIPDSLGPPPDPSKLTKCFPDLLKALDKLLKLLPALSIPKLAKDLIHAIVLGLFALRQQIDAMIRENARIIALQLLAAEPGNIALTPVLDCATQNFSAQLENLNDSMTPLNRLIGIISGFMQLAGLKPLLPLNGLGQDMEAALGPLDATIALLQTAAAAIPG